MGVTPSGANKFSNNSPADIQAFDIAQANWSNTLLTGSKTCNPCLFRTMASRQVAGADMLNDTICASGAYTGSNCGVLKIKDASYFYADYGITLTHQRTASYMRTGGDSGGPVFSGTMAIGSHVNFQPDTGWAVYSHIYNIESSLGMSMCFSSC